MQAYLLIGSNRQSVEWRARTFAHENNGTLHATEAFDAVACDDLDTDSGVANDGAPTVYFVRVDF